MALVRCFDGQLARNRLNGFRPQSGYLAALKRGVNENGLQNQHYAWGIAELTSGGETSIIQVKTPEYIPKVKWKRSY